MMRMAHLLGAVAVLFSFVSLVSVAQGMCTNNWCLNDGTCSDEPPGCYCQDGYEGFYCQYEVTGEEMCEESLCQNDGYCDSDAVVCTCQDGYTGYFCETDLCDSNVDCNGGECVNSSSGSSSWETACVSCPTGYGGPLCETPFGALCGMVDGMCLNHGLCVPRDGTSQGYQCMCTSDFAGSACEINKVCSGINPCRNGGVCMGGSCECESPYSGVLCERVCNSGVGNQCMNGGTCTAMGECTCPDGFEGPRCGFEPCTQKSDCLNGGSCNPDGNCECVSNFEGFRCEIACSMDSECQNGGRCQADGTCNCMDGFSGGRCQNSPPASSLALIIGVVAAIVILLLLIVIILLLVRRRLAMKRHQRAQNGEVELGGHNKRHANTYVDVCDREGPAVARRPQALHYEPDGKPKEFPRELLHVMEQLGAGSFATVHRAEADGITKKGTITTVAIKMLKTMATDGDKRDFEKERHMYLTLGSHPNVVHMLGFCTEKEPFYLIMEFMANGNLQTYIRHIRTGSKEQYFSLKEVREEKRNFLLPAEVLSFASQIANGMEFLASKSCIHRDLATRNILLGDELVTKVSDFGLARDIQGSREYEMKSQSRVPVRWMAPESLLDNIYTSKSDVWGFAVLLWELVTLGSHPYPGMSSKQVIDKVVAGYRLPKPESCSDEIYDMMTGCWSKNPEDRPTFTEICKLLDNMMADASGYLVMSDLNKDDYLYLEPNQTKSVNTADDY